LIRFGDELQVNKGSEYRSCAEALVRRRFSPVMAAALTQAMATAS